MSILNPETFAQNYIKGYDPKDLAQNGLDVRISELYLLDSQSVGRLNGDVRVFPKRTKLSPVNGEYILEPNQHYEVVTSLHVTIPANVAGWLLHRSSLLRMGIIATSGVYDSGFSGGLNLFLRTGPCLVAIGATEKVAQLLVLEAEACKQYDGYFQGTSRTIDVEKPS